MGAPVRRPSGGGDDEESDEDYTDADWEDDDDEDDDDIDSDFVSSASATVTEDSHTGDCPDLLAEDGVE